jgi:hypothetical protein
MTADPVGGDLGDPQTLNRYSYVRNNPINMVDPSGLCGLQLGFFVDPFYGGGEGGRGGGGGIFVGFGGFGGGHCDGDERDGPQPPSDSAPDVGTDPTGGMGCESLGMPCGMQFPAPGGMSGCTYGGGSCGGGIYGFTTDPNTGLTIGSFPGEEICISHFGGDCLFEFWNDRSREWEPQRPSPPPTMTSSPHLYASPSFENCSPYRNGTGAGDILFGICSETPDGPWSNCVRGNLLGQYNPKDNPAHETFIYGIFDHARYFASCRNLSRL